MYIVTAVKDKTYLDYGVEVVGIFDNPEKAMRAVFSVENWMKANGYDDGAVLLNKIEVNMLRWYEMEEKL